MGAVQVSTDNSTVPFIRSGVSLAKEAETLLQDAGRVVALIFGTLMAQVTATKKWVPFTDETATDGGATAKGIYIGTEVTAAALVAGDVVDVPILVGGACTIDAGQLTIENSKTLDTIVGAVSIAVHRVEDDLNNVGIFVENTVDIDEFENA